MFIHNFVNNYDIIITYIIMIAKLLKIAPKHITSIKMKNLTVVSL